MNPKLKALLVSLGVATTITLAGVVSQREFFAPDFTASNAELLDAGISTDCPVRNIRVWALNPLGRIKTQEAKARICNGEPVLSRAARDLRVAGWQFIRVRDLGAAAGNETELADVAPECACTSGANCTATSPAGVVGTTLPKWTVAGPDYRWTNPSGAGCVAMPCIEATPGVEWPTGCPRK